MKRTLLIIGHPDKESFCNALAEAYKNGAIASGATVRSIHVSEIQFDPVLRFGYRKRTELEPDLIAAREDILWAEHLVFLYPVWLGISARYP